MLHDKYMTFDRVGSNFVIHTGKKRTWRHEVIITGKLVRSTKYNQKFIKPTLFIKPFLYSKILLIVCLLECTYNII
jgi:hypothetical protein